MKDLLRSYKLILKRRTSVDSDESQPLVSSYSSASFGAFQEQCMFHDSDTTDCDIQKSTKGTNQIQTEAPNYFLRPFCHPCHFDKSTVDIFTTNDVIHDRCQYYDQRGLDEDSFIKSKLARSYENREPIRTQSSLVTIFATWNTTMGSSLLAMAWGLQKSGLFPGIFLHVLIAGICLYTAHLILKISNDYGSLGRVDEVPDLCNILLGRWAEIISKIFSLIVLIGSNIVYWILMSNFLYNSVNFLHGYVFYASDSKDNQTVICPKGVNATAPDFNVLQKLMVSTNFDQIWNLYTTVPLFLAILMFPLLNFKSPTFFTKFNSLGSLSVMYLLIFVLIKSYSWGIHIKDWEFEVNLKSNFSALSGMLSLSYFIHNIIISIMRSNRYQEKNGRDLCVAYGLVLFTYLFIGVMFYICFPLAKECIEDNILNNFPQYDPMAIVARLLLLFQLLTVYPLMMYMLRINVFTYLKKIFRTRSTEFSYVKVVSVNFVLVTVCVLFACFLPRIGTLIRYTGALSGMIYVFTLPSLLQMASLRAEKALTPCKCFLHVVIILIGILNFCSQFFISDE